MNADAIPAVNRLVRRFAAPVIAAWLLHRGLWALIVSLAEPAAMSVLTKTVNWFIERFTAKAWPIEEVAWPFRQIAYPLEDGAVAFAAIGLGLAIGWVISRRRKTSLSAM